MVEQILVARRWIASPGPGKPYRTGRLSHRDRDVGIVGGKCDVLTLLVVDDTATGGVDVGGDAGLGLLGHCLVDGVGWWRVKSERRWEGRCRHVI